MEHLNETAKLKNRHRDMAYDSLVTKNPVLAGGMAITPVLIFADTFANALTLTAAFSAITFFTLIISSFVPKSIVYTLRIILYVLIGSLVYVVTAILLNELMPEKISDMGIYFPLLITNSLIVSRSETIFFRESRSMMLVDIIFCILGYDIVVLLFGLFRELLSTGGLGEKILAMPIAFSGLGAAFGGFLLLGMFAALYRAILLFANKFKR